MTAAGQIAPEFSVIADLQSIGRQVKKFHLEPGEAARTKIAKRFGIPAIEQFAGDVSLKVTKTEIHAQGRLRATLIRECVSSLDEMTETIDEEFDVVFLRKALNDVQDDGEDDDLPEVHEDDTLDVGELLVQQLSLAMDPFPRKQGAQSLAEEYGRADADSPFRDLKGLLDKNE